MNNPVFLVFWLPVVLSAVIYDFSGKTEYEGISAEDAKEIEELNVLTKRLAESGERFQHPLQSTIKVTNNDVSFYVYNRKNRQLQKIHCEQAQNITNVSSFDTKLDTVFLTHGWHNDYNCTFNSVVGQAFLDLQDVNIILVNWDGLATGLYLRAFCSVPYVGKILGQFIKNISTAYNYPLDKISLIGHSLGAHVCGYAGQETGGAISTIIGLDPAGPLFLKIFKNERLSEDDAQYVQSIHTCSNLLGVNYNVGDIDFWPNGGSHQPGCVLDILGQCSHERSYEYYGESLSSTSDNFIAWQCNSYSNFNEGKCKTNSTIAMGGDLIDETKTGDYYLKTNSQSPYARGYSDI